MTTKDEKLLYDKNLHYSESIQYLDDLQDKLKNEKLDFEKLAAEASRNIPSDLDLYDLLFSITFGLVSALITTSDKISDFCNSLHEDASLDKPRTLFGKILHHTGDYMDKVPVPAEDGTIIKKYINRFGGKTPGPHRIYWGHDIFSFKKDNPFYVLINEYGVLKGIFQALRHLVADTLSNQGLPIPFSSFFDYSYASDGEVTVGNRLLDFCRNFEKSIGKKYGSDYSNFDDPAFNHMFSIHIQDVAAQGLAFALTKAYFRARPVSDKMRQIQFSLICYSVNFFGTCVIGSAKSGGIPYISWPALAAVIKELCRLFKISNRETNELMLKTSDIVERNKELERRVMAAGSDLPTYDNPWMYVKDYYKERKASLDLIDFFEEE